MIRIDSSIRFLSVCAICIYARTYICKICHIAFLYARAYNKTIKKQQTNTNTKGKEKENDHLRKSESSNEQE